VLLSFDAWEENLSANLRAAFLRLGLYKAYATASSPIRQPYAAVFEAASAGKASARAVEVLRSGDANQPYAEIRGWMIDGGFVASSDVPSTLATNTGEAPAVFVNASGFVGVGTTAPATRLEVNGTLRATSLEGGCTAGYARISGRVGTCIQVDPGSEAGCFGDECVLEGMRPCSCVEIAAAYVSGVINPTTDTVSTAGEYCMSGTGHCQGHGAGCNEGTTPAVGKIWPHLPTQRPTWSTPTYPGYVNTEIVSVCDTSKPTAHSGYPYGSYRCCY
jgi:hypothetical protein